MTRIDTEAPDEGCAVVVPVRVCDLCVRVLERAIHLFSRAAHDLQGSDQAAALERRLAPDMFDLACQAVVLADGLCGAAALMAGRTSTDEAAVQWVFNRGDEASLGPVDADFAAVVRRLEEARARVLRHRAASQERRALTGRDTLVVERPGHRRRFDAVSFVERYLTPNAYFHLAMIHALLRAGGARLGKADFEGAPAYAVD